MKKILLATTILAMTAVSAMAADLGYGFSVGADINAEYNLTAGGDIALTATPALYYSLASVDLTIGTDIDLADVYFVGLDLEASYDLNDSFNLYANVSTDENFNFGDVVIGATVSF
jgi:hypothetical protein